MYGRLKPDVSIVIILSVVVSVHDGTVVYLEWKRVVIICHNMSHYHRRQEGRFSPAAGDWWKHKVNLNKRKGWLVGQCSLAGRES
jgi:hypothetical protein